MSASRAFPPSCRKINPKSLQWAGCIFGCTCFFGLKRDGWVCLFIYLLPCLSILICLRDFSSLSRDQTLTLGSESTVLDTEPPGNPQTEVFNETDGQLLKLKRAHIKNLDFCFSLKFRVGQHKFNGWALLP